MSKYVVIGDVHGRTIWRDIVHKEVNADKIIFLGDYVSTHWPEFISEDQEIEELYAILDYKENNKDKVILLRGNHDNEGLGYHWARCYPAVRHRVAQYMRTKDVTGWFLENTQWIYRIPNTNIVCSHAGCSTRFLDNAKIQLRLFNKIEVEDYNDIIDNLNELEPSELFGFTDCNPFDTNGISQTQPCTWIRPETLMNYSPKNIIQVVGHTNVGHIANIKDECLKYEPEKDYPDIWCCDNLANSEYLVIENNEFKVCKI